MTRIGLVKEGKTPPDNRVAFTPAQCQWIKKNIPGVEVIVQSSPNRCFSDKEYQIAGIKVQADISDCDILLGIKEVPITFIDRRFGISKMNKGIVKEGIFGVLKLKWMSMFKNYRNRVKNSEENAYLNQKISVEEK